MNKTAAILFFTVWRLSLIGNVIFYSAPALSPSPT